MRRFFTQLSSLFFFLVIIEHNSLGQVIYTYTGANQTYTVPAVGVNLLQVKIWGAGGGNSSYSGQGGSGGSGAYIDGLLSVSSGQVLNIAVGQGGRATIARTAALGGWPGGGSGGTARTSNSGNSYNGGGGGGYTGIFTSATYSQANALVIAGGGGGGGGYNTLYYLPGGGGGGLPGGGSGGLTTTASGAGQAGTNVAGGAGGIGYSSTGNPGTALTGGTGASAGNTSNYVAGGGGGGGYYGGGGGGANSTTTLTRAAGGGGGGGSYYAAAFNVATNINGNVTGLVDATAPNNTDPDYVAGIGIGYGAGSPKTNGGNGMVVITPIYINDAGITGLYNVAYCPGSNPVQVVLKNFGSANLTSATINWSVNGVPQTPYLWTGNLAFGASTNVTVGNYVFTAGPSYIISAATSLPNGVADGKTANDSYTSPSIQTGLSGIYNVGAAGVYPTLTAAVNAVATNGLCGPTVFNLIDATYSASETFPITIPQLAGSSTVNTLTIKPNTTAAITGSPASPNPILQIFGSNIIIEGSNNGSTSRNLTITNNQTTNTPYCIFGKSNGSAGPLQNIIVKNCIVVNHLTSSTGAIVFSDMSTDVNGNYNSGYFTGIQVLNNDVRRANIGIGVLAESVPGNGTGFVISNNVMNQTGVNRINSSGILALGLDGAVINNNTIANVSNNVANGIATGIELDYGTNLTVSGNTISAISQTGSNGTAIGEYLIGCDNLNLSNNNISSVTTNDASGLFDNAAGIYIVDGANNIINRNTVNTVAVSGNGAYYANGIYVDSDGGNISITNNAVSNISAPGNYAEFVNGIWMSGAGSTHVISNNTINNVSLNAAGGYATWVDGILTDGGGSNYTISDNTITNITTNTASQNASGIEIFAGSNYTLNHNTITSISNGYFYAQGIRGSSGVSNVSITNNSISAVTSPAGGFNVDGLYITGSSTISIADNQLSNITTAAPYTAATAIGININASTPFTVSGNTVSNVSQSAASNAGNSIGIYAGGAAITNSNIFKNQVSNVKTTSTTGYQATGIMLASTSSASNVTAYNNFIYDISSRGANSYITTTGLTITSTGGGYKIYHNSIYINASTQTATTAVNTPIYLSSTLTGTTLDIRNNIFQNATAIGNAANRYAIYSAVANALYSNLDYNVYYTNSGTYLGYLGGANRIDLTALQTAFVGQNSNSLQVQPTFVSVTDLHLLASPSSANFPINNEGTPIALVTTDIDGAARNTYTPDPGADEFLGTGSWIGKIDARWHGSDALLGTSQGNGNWDDGIVPTSVLDAKVGAAPNQPSINYLQPVRNLYLENPALVTLSSGGTLQLYGNINNKAGSINGIAGTIEFAGNIQQTLPASLLTNNDLGNLTLNNGYGTQPQVVLGGPVRIYGELRPTSGVLSLGDNDITLRSIEDSTAYVSKINNASPYFTHGTGRFIVERYVKYTPNWNLLSAPVRGVVPETSILNSWQEGGSSFVSTGFGTRVTGPNPPAPSIATPGSSTTTGLDQASTAYSMKWWSPSAQNYVLPGTMVGSNAVANHTNALAVNNKYGYFIYTRGDRSIAVGGGGTTTILRAKGRIYDPSNLPPSISESGLSAGEFVSVANPYPSAISMSKVYNSGSNGIQQSIQVWDPTESGSYGRGNYQTVDAVNGLVTPGVGLYAGLPLGYKNIQSGQAFFVEASGSSVNINFDENYKVNGSTATLNRIVTNPSELVIISTMLHNGNDGKIADGNRVIFDEELSKGYDRQDATKIMNFGENFAVITDDKQFIVEGRQPVVAEDTIFYNMSGLRIQPYTLSFEPRNLTGTGLNAELIDQFLGTRTNISLTDSSFYNFSVTNDAASKAANRFYLVFKAPVTPVPVKFVSVSATRNTDRSIKVSWSVVNEVNISHYEIERSADGIQFNGILSADVTNSNIYNRNDLSPLAFDNYYRVKAVGINGDITYSNIVKVAPENLAPSIVVIPNPVKGKQMQVRFTAVKEGKYSLLLQNASGQRLYQEVINIGSSYEVKKIRLKKSVASGAYFIKLQNSDNEIIAVEKLFIE